MLVFPDRGVPDVSIVVVAARRPDRLVRCLEAVVREAPDDLDYEVVVVLNAAEPGFGEHLARAVRGVRVVRSGVPLGFAGGARLGVAHARATRLHLLHDDTEVCADWLSSLMETLDARPEAGSVGSLVLNFDGLVQCAGNVLWRDGTTGHWWEGTSPDEDGLAGVRPVDYCGTASLLIRRSAWEAVGGFDARFHPAYFADVDFAMALRKRGYLTLCDPASRVRHEQGGSSVADFREFIGARNHTRFLEKWAGDLQTHESAGPNAEAWERALAATERRAVSIASIERAPEIEAALEAIEDEGELDRLRREHVQAERDIAVKDAFVAHLRQELLAERAVRGALEADVVNARREGAEHRDALVGQQDWMAELNRANTELQRANDASHRAFADQQDRNSELLRLHEHLQRELEAASRERAGLAEELTTADTELADLRARARTLAAIEAGGWWSLRRRLLPLLRFGGRVRALGRSRS